MVRVTQVWVFIKLHTFGCSSWYVADLVYQRYVYWSFIPVCEKNAKPPEVLRTFVIGALNQFQVLHYLSKLGGIKVVKVQQKNTKVIVYSVYT